MNYKHLAHLIAEAREATETNILKEITWYNECEALANEIHAMQMDNTTTDYQVWLKRVELTRKLLSVETAWALYVVYSLMQRCEFDHNIPF